MEQGTLFGKYKIHRQLGRGGMGIVYLAEDTTLLRLVALKVLDQDVTASPHFEQRFLQEARTIASLNHPNIVPIHALSRIKENWVIEMPFVEGGSLMDAEAQGTLDVRSALKCVRDILLALAVCHESGIIHRDVKPSNILLGEQSRGMLSDFGLAKLLSLHQQDSVQTSCSASLFIGTPRYAPPESWEEQEPTPAWDIYSVGMILYEAICGAAPYDAQTPLSLMKQLLERPIPPLKEIVPSVSDALSDLVAHMLTRDPAERIHDSADVLECFWTLPELSEDSLSAPVLLKPLTPRHVAISNNHDTAEPSKTRRKMRRGTFVALLTAMLAVCLGVFTLFDISDVSWFSLSAHTPPSSPRSEGNRSEDLVTFDILDMDSQQMLSGYCITEMSDRKQPWRMLAAGPQHLWFLDIYKGTNNALTIEGYWADYSRVSAPLFRRGTISGKGQWIHKNEDIGATLTFENAENTSVWNQSILFRRSDTPETGPSYLCKLASTDAISSLLYNEIIPRKLEWVNALESFLHTLGLNQLAVYKDLSEANAMVLDGRLRENIWQASLARNSHDVGLETPFSGPTGSFMRVCRNDDALYIGLQIPVELVESRLLVALQRNHAIPVGSAKRFTIQADDGVIIDAKILESDHALPWECNWEVAHTMHEGITQVEIRIPYDEMEMPDTSLNGQRWLLNCQMGTARPDGINAIAQWGNDEVVNTPCGLVLAFLD